MVVHTLRTNLVKKRDLGISHVTECNGWREERPRVAQDALLPSLKAAAPNQALYVSDLEIEEQKCQVKHFCILKGYIQQALPPSVS